MKSGFSRFVVIDVETPNHENNRISAIGVTIIENYRITDEFYTLVNPETYFDDFNINLTGITPEAVASAPTFPEVWTKIEQLIGISTIVAHFAQFDLGVLKCCLTDYNIQWKQYKRYLCTVEMGRAILPGRSHKLNALCEYYGIELEHHLASSDSRACAQILLKYIKGGADPRDYLRTYRFKGRQPQ